MIGIWLLAIIVILSGVFVVSNPLAYVLGELVGSLTASETYMSCRNIYFDAANVNRPIPMHIKIYSFHALTLLSFKIYNNQSHLFIDGESVIYVFDCL